MKSIVKILIWTVVHKEILTDTSFLTEKTKGGFSLEMLLSLKNVLFQKEY